MCWACEEQTLWWREQLELAVARGVIPEGFEPADFEAYGLPVPGSNRARPAASPAMRFAPKPSTPANSFVCDAPESE
jgi:hypothetical protein